MSDFTTEEVPRSSARDVLDLIRTHDQDGYIYPCEASFDGTRVECIGYGRPPDDDDWEERPTQILAIVVDDDLAQQIVPIAHEEEEHDDGEP